MKRIPTEKQLAHLRKLKERGHDTATRRALSAQRRKEPRTAWPLVREFFRLLDTNGMTNKELAALTKRSDQTYINWRRGARAPMLPDFEIAAKAIGFRLALVPDYPEGDVVGACICGSWPGGPCLRCPPKEKSDVE